jgi:hypothetical protein
MKMKERKPYLIVINKIVFNNRKKYLKIKIR